MTQTACLPVRFGVLGPLLVEVGGAERPIGGLKPRLLLAMLLLDVGRIVSTDRLIDGLWEDDPPEGAVNTLQAHVSHLRRLLAPADVALLTQPPGYLLRVAPKQLDLLRFEELTGSARASADGGRVAEGAELIKAALDLWRGRALDDLGSGTFAENSRTVLSERRLGAIDDRLRMLMRLRRWRDVIDTCEEVLATSPLRESVWEELILALYRSGRQADALARYRTCRRILADELGVEPMPRLRALEQQILNHDARLEPRPLTEAPVAPGRAGRPSGTVTALRPQELEAVLVLDDGTLVPVADRAVLGRHPECDIVLTDAAVSRRHAEVRLLNGRHVLVDLTSANGTWIAEQPISQHLLADGDVIGLGEHRLRYRTR